MGTKERHIDKATALVPIVHPSLCFHLRERAGNNSEEVATASPTVGNPTKVTLLPLYTTTGRNTKTSGKGIEKPGTGHTEATLAFQIAQQKIPHVFPHQSNLFSLPSLQDCCLAVTEWQCLSPKTYQSPNDNLRSLQSLKESRDGSYEAVG